MRKHETANGNGVVTTASPTPPPLMPGDRLTRDEFLRRWEEHPEIKFAELIGGIVYMPSPTSREHGEREYLTAGWLCAYQAHTSGTSGGSNATVIMDDDSPQPDVFLRILPECGGQSIDTGKFIGGGPEFITEICVSTAAYDLNQKLELYESFRVQEYLAVLMHEQEIRWHRLGQKGYHLLDPAGAMLWKSVEFPGLWLNGKALLAGDSAKLLATLRRGLRSPEHAAFAKKLAKKKKK